MNYRTAKSIAEAAAQGFTADADEIKALASDINGHLEDGKSEDWCLKFAADRIDFWHPKAGGE